MTRYVVVALRAMHGHESGYDIPLTGLSRGHGEQLLRDLGDDTVSDDAIHEFFFSLVGPLSHSTMPDQWSCPVTSYIALVSVREDGSLVSAEQSTGRLAQFKYFIRSSVLFEADRKCEEFSSILECVTLHSIGETDSNLTRYPGQSTTSHRLI